MQLESIQAINDAKGLAPLTGYSPALKKKQPTFLLFEMGLERVQIRFLIQRQPSIIPPYFFCFRVGFCIATEGTELSYSL